jgi:hypothetical protein
MDANRISKLRLGGFIALHSKLEMEGLDEERLDLILEELRKIDSDPKAAAEAYRRAISQYERGKMIPS